MSRVSRPGTDDLRPLTAGGVRGAREAMLHSAAMPELLRSILEQVRLTTVIDIGLTALLIYWLFSLIRGTRAVRLVIGVSVLFIVYVLAVVVCATWLRGSRRSRRSFGRNRSGR